jgi:hypothetical protein
VISGPADENKRFTLLAEGSEKTKSRWACSTRFRTAARPLGRMMIKALKWKSFGNTLSRKACEPSEPSFTAMNSKR